MPKVQILNQQGENVGELELNEAIFGVDVNEHVVYEVVRNQLVSQAVGTKVYSLTNSMIGSILVLVPSLLSEQQAIAEVLSDMDNEIETLEAELEKLNHMKRGMMQELLTGRIRLI